MTTKEKIDVLFRELDEKYDNPYTRLGVILGVAENSARRYVNGTSVPKIPAILERLNDAIEKLETV